IVERRQDHFFPPLVIDVRTLPSALTAVWPAGEVKKSMKLLGGGGGGGSWGIGAVNALGCATPAAISIPLDAARRISAVLRWISLMAAVICPSAPQMASSRCAEYMTSCCTVVHSRSTGSCWGWRPSKRPCSATTSTCAAGQLEMITEFSST